jgi:hypothetical protein
LLERRVAVAFLAATSFSTLVCARALIRAHPRIRACICLEGKKPSLFLSVFPI